MRALTSREFWPITSIAERCVQQAAPANNPPRCFTQRFLVLFSTLPMKIVFGNSLEPPAVTFSAQVHDMTNIDGFYATVHGPKRLPSSPHVRNLGPPSS